MRNLNFIVGSWLTIHSLLCGYQMYNLATTITTGTVSTIKTVVCIGSSLYLADLFSGVLHVYFDNRKYDLKQNTVLDKIAYSFQTHHEDPQSFIRNSPFYNPQGQIDILMYLSTPVYSLTTLGHYVYPNTPSLFLILYTFNLVATYSQILHGLSHKNPKTLHPIIRVLQKYRIIIHPQDHRTHHKNYDKHFAIVNGWSNSLLNVFFNKLLKNYRF